MKEKFDLNKLVLVGETTEASLRRTSEILRDQGLNPNVTIEFISKEQGVFSGYGEISQIISRFLPKAFRDEVWCLNDGDIFAKGEVILRINCTFAVIANYITAINGIISSSSGWATGAKECVDSAEGIPIVNFGAPQVHPNVVGIMDYSSIQGGAKGCSSILGASLSDLTPVGSMNESLVIILGDVVEAAEALVNSGEPELPKVVSIGILGDESEEAKKVVENFPSIRGLKIETPDERGGIKGEVLREVRERLDQLGFINTQLSISGDLNPKSIQDIIEIEKEWQSETNINFEKNEIDSTPSNNLNRRLVQAIGIDRYIACRKPLKIGSYLKLVDGNPVAKRGQVPGILSGARLNKMLFGN